MSDENRCTSCGITLIGLRNTVFPCPECGVTTINRCKRCRDQGEAYECSECGFRGP